MGIFSDLRRVKKAAKEAGRHSDVKGSLGSMQAKLDGLSLAMAASPAVPAPTTPQPSVVFVNGVPMAAADLANPPA